MKLGQNSLNTVPFECRCGTMHNSADGKLPVGWSTCQGETWCTDCTRAGIASRQIRQRTPRAPSAEKLRLRGEVEQLLREGSKLMPRAQRTATGQKRAEWVQRVNTLMAQIGSIAA